MGLRQWVFKQSKKENALGKLVIFLHSIFSNLGFRFIGNTILSLILTLSIKMCVLDPNTSIFDYITQSAVFIPVLLVIGFNLLALLSDSALKITENKKQRELIALRILEDGFHHKTLNCVSIINDKTLYLASLEKRIEEHLGLEKKAYDLCESIYEYLSKALHSKNHKIFLFQRDEEDNEKVFLLAYGITRGEKPYCCDRFYDIHDNINGEALEFLKIFRDNIKKPLYYISKKQIKEESVIIDPSNRANSQICQYIAIPITDIHGRVIFSLNIDIDIGKSFGTTRDEIDTFQRDTIRPFITLFNLCITEYTLINRVKAITLTKGVFDEAK